jgi:nucleotidyltransferase/DNA polymerase involved in DNA repair
MERLACVDFPEFSLQLLILKHPEWKRLPAAVVAQDKPQSEILWVSPEARTAGVLPGMRYAQGLSLATDLRAAVVPIEEVQAEVWQLADLLRRSSPEIEVSEEEPGVFWVNAAGLLGLFSSLDLWAKQIHRTVTATGLRASVVVGFRRFAVYAIAKGREGVLVLESPGEEDVVLREISLSVLTIDPRLRDTLAKLDVHTVGEFLGLPAAAIRRRFGDEAARLHALALGDAHDPLAPVFPIEPATCQMVLDTPEGNSVRLLFAIQEHLHPLLAKLAKQGEVLQELEIHFQLDQAVSGQRTPLHGKARNSEMASGEIGGTKRVSSSRREREGEAPTALPAEGATQAPIGSKARNSEMENGEMGRTERAISSFQRKREGAATHETGQTGEHKWSCVGTRQELVVPEGATGYPLAGVPVTVKALNSEMASGEIGGTKRVSSSRREREGEAPTALPAEGATQAPIIVLRIQPAEATLDKALILDLLRLKLEGSPLSAPAREIQVTAHGMPGPRQQIRLFLKAQRRDLAAANRALARIRAELGEEVVVRARLTDEHLPEARFTWEPLPHLTRAHPSPEGKPGLVRRLYSRPVPLRMILQQAREGQSIRDLYRGQVVRSWGPYVLSGEWWRNLGEDGIHRRYYFLETPDGKVLWVYYDGHRQRWFLQGQVE